MILISIPRLIADRCAFNKRRSSSLGIYQDFSRESEIAEKAFAISRVPVSIHGMSTDMGYS